MKKLLFIFAVALRLSTGAQSYQWAKSIVSPVPTSNDANIICSAATDVMGNVYVTGSFYGTNVDFNPGGAPLTLSSNSNFENVFFAKYSPSGSCTWAKAILGAGGGRGESILIGPAGDIYITGVFGGTNIDFDPGPGTATLSGTSSQSDIFIARYDASGNYLWAKSIGGAGNDYSQSLSLDAVGNVYITGSFDSPSVDFDPGPGIATLSSAGVADLFFAKYDVNGNYLWARSIGSTGIENSCSISVDAAGNACITGYFQGSATDFDPGPGTATLNALGTAIFFARYDAGGNYLWARSILASGNGGAIGVHPGGIYISGAFTGANVDFDPGPSTASLSSVPSGTFLGMYLAKYDHNGNYLWAKVVERAGSSHMAISASEKLYVIGGFAGGGTPLDFDPGPGTATLSSVGGDVFFAKYDADGDYVWARSVSNPAFNSYEKGAAIVPDASENVFIGGVFTGANVEFDPGPGTATLSSAGYKAMFLAKYGYCSQQVNNSRHICTGQSIEVGGNSYTSSGTYTDVLYTSFGCDSIVVTQLTVSGQPPVVTISSSSLLCTGSSNTLSAGGAVTYTWSTGAQAPVITVTPTNVMQYVVAGTGTNGCVVNSTLNVLPSPTLGILARPIVCQGEQVTATATGANSYTWSTGAQTPGISAILNSTTAFTVTGIVSGTPCLGRGTLTVNVNPCLGMHSNYAGSIKLTLYPNPARTELFYTLSVNGIHRYVVTDYTGAIMEDGEQSGSKVRLDVSAYPPGIYNLTVTIGKTSLDKRFLVEKRD